MIHRTPIGPAAFGCPNAIGERNPAPHTRFLTVPGMRDASTLKGPGATEI